jgi:hypothetical protein
MADTGGITAQVINIMHMLPVKGADAVLSGPAQQQTTTGEDGKFTFNNLPPGTNYKLDVSASGFGAEHYEDIVVIEDIVTDLQKLALRPEY